MHNRNLIFMNQTANRINWYFLIYIIIAGCLFSCKSNNESAADITFDFDDFSQVDLSSKGIRISDNPDILGIVSNIKVVNDSIIAISQRSGQSHVILYNINTDKWQTAVKRGDGPDEMLNVTSLSADSDGQLWMSGLMDRKIMTAKWNDADGDGIREFKMKSPYDLLRGVSDGEGGIIGFPASLDNLRAIHLNSNGITLDSLSQFPITILPDSVSPNNFMFQADMAYCPQNKKLAIANRSWNLIEIFSLDNGNYISLKAPLKDDIMIRESNRGNGVSYNPSPLWFTFSNVSTCEQSFMVGYLGVKVEKDEDFDRQISQLLEFAWDGKPMNQYLLNSEALAFDVDFKNQVIYIIENNPDPVLMKYEL